VGKERAARVGEDGAPADPVEQRRAQLALEQVDATADRRLREVERRGRARESAAPHDRHERLDVIQLHSISIADDYDKVYALDTLDDDALS
jgi:hypothetical protein